jgi:hypothetical protein
LNIDGLDMARRPHGIVSGRCGTGTEKAAGVAKHAKKVICPGCGGSGKTVVVNDGTSEEKPCQLCGGTGWA